jgi:hypothetical protein
MRVCSKHRVDDDQVVGIYCDSCYKQKGEDGGGWVSMTWARGNNWNRKDRRWFELCPVCVELLNKFRYEMLTNFERD